MLEFSFRFLIKDLKLIHFKIDEVDHVRETNGCYNRPSNSLRKLSVGSNFQITSILLRVGNCSHGNKELLLRETE